MMNKRMEHLMMVLYTAEKQFTQGFLLWLLFGGLLWFCGKGNNEVLKFDLRKRTCVSKHHSFGLHIFCVMGTDY